MSKKAVFCKCTKKYQQECDRYNCKYDYMEPQGLGSLVNNGSSVVSEPEAPRTITGSRSGVES